MNKGSKFKPKGSWRAKLEKKQEPVVKTPPGNWIEKYGGNKMLIATPMLVDAVMRIVTKGNLITIGTIRGSLAKQFHADFTCPLTTGIFARIAAETAEEYLGNGMQDITPWWRLIKDDSTLNPKFPDGPHKQASYLKYKGFEIIKKGKNKLEVKGHEDFIRKP
jgi:hypothetical protein